MFRTLFWETSTIIPCEEDVWRVTYDVWPVTCNVGFVSLDFRRFPGKIIHRIFRFRLLILNPKLIILNIFGIPAVCCFWFVVCGLCLWLAVCGLWFVVCGLCFEVLRSAVLGFRFAVHWPPACFGSCASLSSCPNTCISCCCCKNVFATANYILQTKEQLTNLQVRILPRRSGCCCLNLYLSFNCASSNGTGACIDPSI